MKRIAYIVAIWGDRENDRGELVLSHILEAHVKALLQNKNECLSEILFVINTLNISVLQDEVDTFMNSDLYQKLSKLRETGFLVRDNLGFSYGAWEAGLKSLLGSDITHSFLIEDDYVPSYPEFLEAFLSKTSSKRAFVCQKFEAIPNVAPKHAAVSNGLISMKTVSVVFETYNQIFSIFPYELGRAEHLMGTENQITFLTLFETLGFEIVDISDSYSVKFFETNTSEMHERGNGKYKSPLKPLVFT
jgi:hypothetical protein